MAKQGLVTERTVAGRVSVKLADVAELAGTSLSTVSRVLNRRKYFERLSAATIERVHAAAKQLNYQPHHVAQTLATNRSMVIGIYVHVAKSFAEGKHQIVGEGYGGEVMAAAESYFRDRGYDMLLVNMSAANRSLEQCAAKFKSRQVDGILTVYSCDTEELEYLAGQGVPAVAIDYAGPAVNASYVSLDNRAAVHAAVDHLVELGHRNIGFLGACNPEMFGDWRVRSEAFLERMRHHALAVRHHLVWPNTPEMPHKPDFQYYEAEWAINHLAKCEDRPTALITISDVQAFAAIRQMNVLGLNCPRDMSIVGFDDGVLSRWAMPKMTSVSHCLPGITQRACEVLLGHIEQWYVGKKWQPVQEQMGGTLTVRESTAAVGGGRL